MHALEKAFLDILKEFKPEDLEYAVRKQISLARLVITKAPEFIPQARFIAITFSHKVYLMTAKNMLEWIYQNRYDLYPILNTFDGKSWLEKNIKDMFYIIYHA